MKTVNLFLGINEWCNLDCSYCNVYKTQKSLSFDDCKKSFIYFLKFFQEANAYNVYFMAGEPMLSYGEIKKSILFLESLSKKIGKPISTYMPTNGTLLSQEHLQFFKIHNHQISISIDSFSEDYDYRNIRGSEKSSASILLQKLELFQQYKDIIRIKMVVMPDTVENISKTFSYLYNLGFSFINIQPAHGVFWSEEKQKEYISELLKVKIFSNGIQDIRSTTLKGTQRDSSDTPQSIGCAKGKNEIFIDAYGKVYVCDAFLAYPIEKRKEFAHDDIFQNSFDTERFEKYRDWKYCNNTVLDDEKDITKCKTCNETKSCSTLCNALPNNNENYDREILLSNFNLYRKLDKIGV